MVIIANAFSLNMIPEWMLGEKHPGSEIAAQAAEMSVQPVKLEDVKRNWADAGPDNREWAIGHADTSAVVSKMVEGKALAANRVNVSLCTDDVLYVAQYRGPRLPEGSTELPEGSEIKWLEVTIKAKF